jgi:glycerol-3-phosphate acyltransferase PlsX
LLGKPEFQIYSLMSNTPITIALDCMGGDHGPEVIVPAAFKALSRHPDLHLILVGQEPAIEEVISAQKKTTDRLSIHPASQVVGMDELPSQALRGKKDSSMRVAINLVKEGTAQACVSAGNTGALMATARFVLKTLPGIDRPAICTTLPTIDGHTHVLDLGANVDSDAQTLFEFAVMGAALTAATDNKSEPTLGLLNIGEEEIKGNERVKEAARLLASSKLNYIGYVEGDGIFKGAADVIVCDGFVGNVMLKTTEGVAKMISYHLRKEFKRNPLTMLVGLLSIPVLRAFKKRFDPREYNGASLLGLQGIVIKSHGSADAYSFATAISEALVEVNKNVPARITRVLESQLAERQES